MSEPIEEKIVIASRDLIEELTLLRDSSTRFSCDEIILSFDGMHLHMELGGVSTYTPASGRLDAQLRIRADVLFLWIERPPQGDPITLVFKDNSMWWGTTSTAVKRQSVWSKTIEIPMNATLMDMVALTGKYSREELEASGLWVAHKQAVQELRFAFDNSEAEYLELGLDPGLLFECLLEGIDKVHGKTIDFDL